MTPLEYLNASFIKDRDGPDRFNGGGWRQTKDVGEACQISEAAARGRLKTLEKRKAVVRAGMGVLFWRAV